jgi:phosphatidylserine/phosphatidylglycerophosphate/cardiolipin synthase-like enzyme
VHVLFNPQKSSGERGNDDTFELLSRAGVAVSGRIRASCAREGARGRRRARADRHVQPEPGVLRRDPRPCPAHRDLAQVRAIAEAFEADWHRKPYRPREDTGLVWSPDNARRLIASFIDEARHTLDVQHPKFVDATVIDRFAEAQARGVRVRILCGGKHGLSPWDMHDTFASLRILERCDVKVHRQKHLKAHAKLLLADGKRALVGSMNLDRSAFDLRRELGVRLDDPPVVERLGGLFDHDWHKAERWTAPDPLATETHDIGELPHDPHFVHE